MCEATSREPMALDAVSLAISLADGALKIYGAIEDYVEAKAELEGLLPGFDQRVQHIKASLYIYFHGITPAGVPGYVLGRTTQGFQVIQNEFEKIKKKHTSRNIVRTTLRKTQYVVEVRRCHDRLEVMEREVNFLGLIINNNKGLQDQNKKIEGFLLAFRKENQQMFDAVRNELDAVGNSINHTNYISNPATPANNGLNGGVSKVNVPDGFPDVPMQAREVLDALSKSGISNSTKRELARITRKVWEDWKVDPKDINFMRKQNGDRLRIGATDVYRATMKLRDDNNDVIMGELKEVAVKVFVVPRSQEKEKFPLFIREVYLQKNAQHRCIVRTVGGHWPQPEDDEDVIEPYIVMEKMTHNLQQVQRNELLKSKNMKRRILGDVAAGISHLHSLGIVHRDINMENVLLMVDNGSIIGNAKVCNFGVSRRAHNTDVLGDAMHPATGLAGSSKPYIAPEAHSNSVRQASKTARDVWSFGVMMCEILKPDFLDGLIDDDPGNSNLAASGQVLAEKIRTKAINTFRGDVLGEIVIKCLSINPKARPPIEDVLEVLVQDGPKYQFHFMNYLSLQYREKEVVRYVQDHFDADAQLTNLVGAVYTLDNEIGQGRADVSAQNVLAYCYYFGIGVRKDEEKAISIYRERCSADDRTSMCCLGAIHFRAQSFNESVPLLTKAAGMGCAVAMIWLATCYQYGYGGVEIDTKKAFKLIANAAELRNEEALVRLAEFYQSGIGTDKNELDAFKILNKLNNDGNARAAMVLGFWHKQGLGVPPDEGKAEDLFTKARERGIVDTWDFSDDRNNWILSA